MPPNIPFILGILLGCAARHPAHVLHTGCASLCSGLFACGWIAVCAAGAVVEIPATRHLALLLGFGLLAERAVGGGASVLITLFLAAKLPWAGGNARTLRRIVGPDVSQESPFSKAGKG